MAESVDELPSVTVLVPVRDRREQMLRCLGAIVAQDYPAFDVVVLDNGSTDGTVEACRELGAHAAVPVRVEVVPGRVGRVRNVGARLAGGEIIAFTDSDCVPSAGWLRAGVMPFVADDEVGVVTGTTQPESETGRWAATIEVTEQTWRFEACNVFFRRQALLTADGFDEHVTMWEDTAAGWSVLRRGWRADFEPAALVHHDVTYPGWGWHLRRVLRYGDVALVARRYPELAERLFWHRYFLRERNARTVAAVAGVMLARVTPAALLLALPYALFRRPPRPTPRALLDSVQLTIFDLAVMAGMVRGSLEARRLVL